MRNVVRLVLLVVTLASLALASSGVSALADQSGPGANAPVADQIGPGA
jgi:hypothetical protein